MAYCIATDVQAEFKDIDFSADGAAMSSSKVAAFIAQADAIIDSHLAGIYTVPIAGGESALAVLKAISIAIVRERIAKILSVKSGVESVDQNSQSSAGRDLDLNPWIMLKKLQNRSMILSDATLAVSAGGVASYAQSNDLEHTFKKGDEQW